MRLQLDRIIRDDARLLGPGKRVIIWTHGCFRKCKGCITEKRNQSSGQVLSLSVRAILDYVIQEPDTEGVTISGGEPFLQSESLAELTELLNMHGIGIIIYSGYLYEELQSMPFAEKVLRFTDVLIDGPYIQELDDNKPFRGSSNQKIHLLTERYDSFYNSQDCKRICSIKQRGVYCELTGIPDKKSRLIWHEIQNKGETL